MTTPPEFADDRTQARVVGAHAGARLVADATGRGLHLLLIYAAQRLLGPSHYGHLAVAMALGFILASATNLGLPLIVTREVSRRRGEAPAVAGAAVVLKLALSAGAIVLLAVAAAGRPPGVQLATFVVGLALIAASFVDVFGSALRGLQRVHEETGLMLLSRVLAVLFAGWALWAGFGLFGFGVAYLISAVVAAGCSALWVARRCGRWRLRYDPVEVRPMLRAALPLGGAGLISVVYTRTGVFVLDLIHGSAAAGVFSVAQKLTEPLAFIPAAVMAPVFPAISRQRGERERRLRRVSLQALLLAGGAIALTGVVFGPWLIRQLYPAEYGDAAAVLQVLSLAVIPVFLNYALTHFLIAEDKQHLQLRFSALIFVVHAALCVVLVPAYGVGAAAGALLFSEIVLLTLCAIAIGRRS